MEGKGMMSPYVPYERFDGVIMPARLDETEMKAVAAFVLDQARGGWK